MTLSYYTYIISLSWYKINKKYHDSDNYFNFLLLLFKYKIYRFLLDFNRFSFSQ